MRITNWLTAVYRRYFDVSGPGRHVLRRRRHHRGPWLSKVGFVETLETRSLLSGVPTPIGLETRVNTYTTALSAGPSVAKDAAGDYVVTWVSSKQVNGSIIRSDIYARRFNKDGVAQAAEFLVNIDTNGSRYTPAVAMNAGGDFVITWNSFNEAGSTSQADVYARRYDAAGIARGGEFRVNNYTTDRQEGPLVAMDTAGDFVITWNSPSEGTTGYGNFSCYAQRYNASGSPQGGEFRVNAAVAGRHEAAAVAMNSGGDFVITWKSESALIFAKRYNSAGTAQGNEFQVTPSGESESASSVAMDSAGDFVIAWANLQTSGSGNLGDIKARRYNSAGVAQGNAFLVDTYVPFPSSFGPGASFATVAMDATGDFVITWSGYHEPGGALSDVDSQAFDANGVAQGNEFRVNTSTLGDQYGSTVAIDSAGDFVIVWFSQTFSNRQYYDNVYSQRYKVIVADSPTVTAPTSSSVTSTSVTLGGAVTGDGGSTVTARGIAFALTSVNSNPQIGGTGVSIISATGTTGQFAVNATGLHPGAQYSFVAYATNSVGTSYTQVARFTMLGGPNVSGLGATESYLKGSTPLAIAPHVVVADTAGVSIANATVTITNWVNQEDRLSFHNSFALNHTFVVNTMTNTAVLTLTGAATATAYTTTLRSLTFQDVNFNAPVLTARHVRITVSDAFAISTAATAILTVQNIDLPPVLKAIETSPLAYTANTAAVPISATLLINDPDSKNLTMATVQITSGYQNNAGGHDVLSFVSRNGITGSFSPSTGTMTLTGKSSVGNYRTALRSITFSTLGTGLATATRALTIAVTDDYSPTPLKSLPISRTIAVTGPLTLTGYSGAKTFVKGSVPMPIFPNLLIADSATANISSATVTLTNWNSHEDRLNFSNSHGLQHTFVISANTAVLTLSGTATVLSYQATLRSMTYQDVNFNAPDLTRRAASIAVTDSFSNRATAMIQIAVKNVNLAPVLSKIEVTPLAYARNTVPLPISATLLVTDSDSNNLSKATVQITSGYQNNAGGHDLLSFVKQNGITGSFNPATGTLSLTGSSSVGNYRLALRSITFSTTGATISTAMRTLTIITTDDNPSTPMASKPVTRNITVQ